MLCLQQTDRVPQSAQKVVILNNSCVKGIHTHIHMRTHQLLSVFNSLHISLRLSVHSPYGHCDVWSVAKLPALCDTQGGLFHRSLCLCHTQSTFSLRSRMHSPPHTETPLLLSLHGGGNQKVSWLRAGIRQIHLRGDHNGQGQDHSYSNLSRSYSPSKWQLCKPTETLLEWQKMLYYPLSSWHSSSSSFTWTARNQHKVQVKNALQPHGGKQWMHTVALHKSLISQTPLQSHGAQCVWKVTKESQTSNKPKGLRPFAQDFMEQAQKAGQCRPYSEKQESSEVLGNYVPTHYPEELHMWNFISKLPLAIKNHFMPV